MFSSQTKINFIIGNPVSQSLSPKLHNYSYKQLNLDSDFVFLAKKLVETELGDFVKNLDLFNVNGLSVTIPFKEKVMPLLDEIDPVARLIGAVNTVKIDPKTKKTTGYNTDWLGVLIPLYLSSAEQNWASDGRGQIDEKNIDWQSIPNFLKEKNVAVLGSGGASRAMLYAVLQKGAKVKIFNRTKSRAEQIAADFLPHFPDKIEVFELAEIERISNCQIILNSTSVGMHPETDQSLVPPEYLNKEQIVLDAVYKPPQTKLLQQAKSAGAKTITGLKMLIWQAIFQFELYTGQKVDYQTMKNALN